MNNSKCLAKPANGRAALAIGFPVGAVLIIVYSLTSKGYYYPRDYWDFFFGGDEVITSIIGLIALIFWIVRYWPPAIHVLIHEMCIVSISSESIIFSNGDCISIKDVESVSISATLSGKYILVRRHDGTSARQPILFAQERPATVLRSIIDELGYLDPRFKP